MLRKYLESSVLVYLDDIIIYFRTFKEYKQHIKQVFQVLKKTNLIMKFKKYDFIK